jgi:hypothetical protein
MNYIYVIFPTLELPLVDLSQTCITSMETLRFSKDGSLTFIDWLETQPTPDFIDQLTHTGFISNDEMIEILATPEWQPKEQQWQHLQ